MRVRVTHQQNLLHLVDMSTSLEIVCPFVNSIDGRGIFKLWNKHKGQHWT